MLGVGQSNVAHNAGPRCPIKPSENLLVGHQELEFLGLREQVEVVRDACARVEVYRPGVTCFVRHVEPFALQVGSKSCAAYPARARSSDNDLRVQALRPPLVERGPTQLVDALLHLRAGHALQASLARPSQAHASGTRHFAIARCKFPHGQAVKVQGRTRACRSRYSDPQSYILQAHDIHVFLYAYTYICLHNIIHYYREKCALLSG